MLVVSRNFSFPQVIYIYKLTYINIVGGSLKNGSTGRLNKMKKGETGLNKIRKSGILFIVSTFSIGITMVDASMDMLTKTALGRGR